MSTSKVQFAASATKWELILYLSPVPAARPRVGRWGTYYPKTYAAWKETAKQMLRTEAPEPSDQPLFVIVDAVCKKPAKPSNEYPAPDVDNYAKAILDAVTESQRIWKDDKQIVTLYATKRWCEEDEEPHCFVAAIVHEMGSGEDVYDLPPEFREQYTEDDDGDDDGGGYNGYRH